MRPQGVTPVEVWDAEIDGRTLFEWQDDPRFADALVEVVLRVSRDRGISFSQVYLSGGRALRPGLADRIAARGLAVLEADDPAFGAAHAARSGLVPERVSLAADIGQTRIKLVSATRSWLLDRDFTAAPFRDEVPHEERERARATTLTFLAEALGSEAATGGEVVLALPCEIGSDASLSGCTYCWRTPDATFLAELAAELDVRLFVLNDAELAAVAARRDPRHEPGPTMVLTLGFGVGGAILT